MLMDGALERLAAAKGAIANGSMETKARMIQRTMAIVDELRSSLNREAGGEIATNLDALYDYFGRQLVRANLENRVELLDEVANLMREIRSAWILMPGAAARAATP
jgi:flagellar protein FliS